jgi:hypothetical protein
MIPFYFDSNINNFRLLNLFMNSLQTSLIHNALTKKYEERSPQEHKVLTTAIAPLFPILTPKKIKLLTFFLELREAPAEIFP